MVAVMVNGVYTTKRHLSPFAHRYSWHNEDRERERESGRPGIEYLKLKHTFQLRSDSEVHLSSHSLRWLLCLWLNSKRSNLFKLLSRIPHSKIAYKTKL